MTDHTDDATPEGVIPAVTPAILIDRATEAINDAVRAGVNTERGKNLLSAITASSLLALAMQGEREWVRQHPPPFQRQLTAQEIVDGPRSDQ